ncbi:MAG: TIGR04255 family protein [Mariprofundus sp.]|nr:TIGR04255 family protein [Mariprofundus sp.]
MSKIRTLSNAPIIEALVDIQVQLPADISKQHIDDLKNELSDSYPESEDLFSLSAQIKIEPSGEAPSSEHQQKYTGCRLRSSDKSHIVQLRTNGLSVSRLNPYVTWDDLESNATELWNLYVKHLRPEFITRVALRYINRIEVPLPVSDLHEYLVTPPIVPSGLPNRISEFVNRIVIHDQNIDARAIIIQAFEGVANDKTLPIILDIDVFKEGRLETDDKDIWNKFTQLRDLKNQIFFESLTEKTIGMYE